MNTYRVEMLVREMQKGKLVALYVSADIELAFVPTVGMQFQQGVGTWLWETATGELIPAVETVTYDLDDNVFTCMFTVDQPLLAAFWDKIEGDDLNQTPYSRIFQPRPF